VNTVRIIAGPVRGAIQGYQHLPPDVKAALSARTQFEIEGAWYVHAAKAAKAAAEGQDPDTVWDGRIRLLTNSGTYPAGLTAILVEELQRLGYYVEVVQPRTAPPPTVTGGQPQMTLYPIQEAAVIALLQERVPPRGILHAAPRSGKTLMAAEIARRLGQERTLFLCERLDIARQAVEKFRAYLPEHWTIGHAYDGEFEPGNIVIATVQTLCHVLGIVSSSKRKKGDVIEQPLPDSQRAVMADFAHKATVILVDECHHAAAESYRAVLKRCTNAYWVYGLSGSPWRDDGADLWMIGAIGPILYTIGRKQMIDAGLLVPCHIYLVTLPKKRFPSKWNYAQRRAEYVIRNPVRNAAIAEWTKYHVEAGHSVMILVDYITHARVLHNALDQYGVPHAVMTASCQFAKEGDQRPQVWQDLQDKKVPCLITTLANEGIDVPSLDCVVIAGGGESTVQAVQRLRCMTAYPGKQCGYVLDFNDQARYFSTHALERLRTYQSEDPGVFEIHHVTSFADLTEDEAERRLADATSASDDQ